MFHCLELKAVQNFLILDILQNKALPSEAFICYYVHGISKIILSTDPNFVSRMLYLNLCLKFQNFYQTRPDYGWNYFRRNFRWKRLRQILPTLIFLHSSICQTSNRSLSVIWSSLANQDSFQFGYVANKCLTNVWCLWHEENAQIHQHLCHVMYIVISQLLLLLVYCRFL